MSNTIRATNLEKCIMNRVPTRLLFFAVVAVLLTPVLAIGAPASAMGAQASANVTLGSRGDAAHTGVMPGDGPTTQPGVLWDVPAGGDVSNGMAIRGELLFYTSRTPSVVGAIDRLTGTQVWTVDLGAEAWAYAPEPAGELVVVAVRMSEGDHAIVAFEAATGDEAWRVSVGQPSNAVTHADGIIYVPTERASTPAGTNSILYALDAATGNQRWEFSDPDALKFNQASVSDGIVVVTVNSLVDGGAGAYAFDSVSGDLMWEFTEDDGINRPAVIGNGIAILHSLPWVWGVDLHSGAILWEVLGTSAGGGIAMGPEIAYIGFEDELRAVNPVDGSTRWSAPVSGIAGPPTVTSGLVYTGVWRRGDERGPHMLHAFDASSGAVAWSLELEHFITTNHPLAHDGMLYLDANTSVVAFGDASAQTGGSATEPASESGGEYASPEFGHTIAWNAPWSLSQPQSWSEPGQDFLTLVSGDANLALRATSGVGSPQQFIEFYASSTQARENAEVVTSTDDPGFGRAVARFTVDGASYIEYVEVRALPDNGLFLTILLAPESGFSQAHQAAQQLVTVDQQPPFRAAPSLPGG